MSKCVMVFDAEVPAGFRFRCVHCPRTFVFATREPGEINAVCAPRPSAPTDGPGTKTKEVLGELGIRDTACESCRVVLEEMNRAGVDGVRARRAEFAKHLKHAADQRGWALKFKAAIMAFRTGLAWQLSVADPYGSVIDEALRRC